MTKRKTHAILCHKYKSIKAMKRRVDSGTVNREPWKAEKGRWSIILFVFYRDEHVEAVEDGLGAAHRGRNS